MPGTYYILSKAKCIISTLNSREGQAKYFLNLMYPFEKSIKLQGPL